MATKRCPPCGAIKPISEFHRDAGRLDGLQARCKSCHVEANRKSRLNNPEANRERHRRRTQKNPEQEQARKAAWQAANREKIAAQRAVRRELRAGRMARPNTCDSCGVGADQFRIEAHHDDYARPVDVMWLCSPCHGQRHLELRKALAA